MTSKQKAPVEVQLDEGQSIQNPEKEPIVNNATHSIAPTTDTRAVPSSEGGVPVVVFDAQPIKPDTPSRRYAGWAEMQNDGITVEVHLSPDPRESDLTRLLKSVTEQRAQGMTPGDAFMVDYANGYYAGNRIIPCTELDCIDSWHAVSEFDDDSYLHTAYRARGLEGLWVTTVERTSTDATWGICSTLADDVDADTCLACAADLIAAADIATALNNRAA